MALHERSEQAIRQGVSRLVAVRWPGERILLSTPCEAERIAGRMEAFLGLLGRVHCPGGSCAADMSHLREPALLCVTSRRLIYQGRRPHGVPLRAVSVALAALAILALLGEHAPVAFAGLGLAAAAAWFAADLAQAFGARSGTLEFGRVLHVDGADQWLDGVGGWGTRYRVRIPDPGDFRFVAAMVEHGAA